MGLSDGRCEETRKGTPGIEGVPKLLQLRLGWSKFPEIPDALLTCTGRESRKKQMVRRNRKGHQEWAMI